ncbi:MAG: hypothetical protein O7G86_03760, partial [Gammaproteobacteria bacterium]|nr:hypothetical protein [Gammaproteobacteria bacterium]
MAISASAAEILLTSRAADQLVVLAAEKRARTDDETKLDTGLWYAVKRERGDSAPFSSMPELRTGRNIPRTADNLARVIVRGAVTAQVTTTIQSLGGRLIDIQAEHDTILADMPVNGLQPLAGLPEVRFIRQAFPPITNKINTSEGVLSHDVTVVQNFFGLDGTGVKTCVISDSFDNLGGATALIASGDLPGPGNPDGRLVPIDVVADLPSGGSDEGRAMLEIVFDLVPGSTLGFATAGRSKGEFANNIRALEAAGCNVIVDDVFFFSEAVFQDDVIAAAVDDVVHNGVLYFSAAGNAGNLNDGTSGVWEGDFVAAPAIPPALQGLSISALDFGGGANTNVITDDAPFAFTLHWSDPLGASGNDYDLLLLDPAGENILDLGATIQNGNDDPFEAIDSRGVDDTGRLLAVALDAGFARVVHLNTKRGRLERNTNSQISGHAAADGAFAVAAVRVGAGSFRS